MDKKFTSASKEWARAEYEKGAGRRPRPMADVLKPCPFCGGEAEWNEGQTGDGSPWRYLACADCEAMGPHVSEAELSKTAPDRDAYNDSIRIAAWNRRAALAQAPQVGVKPLEWWQSDTGDWIADTLTGRYQIQHGGKEYPFWLCMYAMGLKHRREFIPDPTRHETLEEAQSAAQADYEARIRSALAPEPEAVRGGQENDDGWWNYRINYGPDGEANYANVYTPDGEFVGNLRIQHARAIVGGLNDAALSSPAQGQKEGACLGFVNVYRHEDGTPVLGSTDLDDDPSDPAYAAEYCEFIGKAKVVLLTSHKEGGS